MEFSCKSVIPENRLASTEGRVARRLVPIGPDRTRSRVPPESSPSCRARRARSTGSNKRSIARGPSKVGLCADDQWESGCVPCDPLTPRSPRRSLVGPGPKRTGDRTRSHFPISRSGPKRRRPVGWRFLPNKGAVWSAPMISVFKPISSIWSSQAGCLPKPATWIPALDRISQENLEKSAHGPAKSRRPRLSTVGQASSAGSGVSKVI